jgi:hypothetical protein
MNWRLEGKTHKVCFLGRKILSHEYFLGFMKLLSWWMACLVVSSEIVSLWYQHTAQRLCFPTHTSAPCISQKINSSFEKIELSANVFTFAWNSFSFHLTLLFQNPLRFLLLDSVRGSLSESRAPGLDADTNFSKNHRIQTSPRYLLEIFWSFGLTHPFFSAKRQLLRHSHELRSIRRSRSHSGLQAQSLRSLPDRLVQHRSSLSPQPRTDERSFVSKILQRIRVHAIFPRRALALG